MPTDIASEASVNELFGRIDAELPPVAGLVNLAGIASQAALHECELEQFERVMAVNVTGSYLMLKAAAARMIPLGVGRIVNTSSVSSSTGFIEQSVYGGSKAALEAMTRTWARELAERATVNAVNPGPVLGEMYARNTDDFKREIRGWISHAPLMRARPGVDAEDLVRDAEVAGGRPAYVDEVAGVVAMLCSADAAWCTGQVVCANGGMLMMH